MSTKKATKKAAQPPSPHDSSEESDEEIKALKLKLALKKAAKKKEEEEKAKKDKEEEAKKLAKKKKMAELKAKLKALEEAGSDDMELDASSQEESKKKKKKKKDDDEDDDDDDADDANSDEAVAKPAKKKGKDEEKKEKPAPAPKKKKTEKQIKNPNAVEFDPIDAGIEEKPAKKKPAAAAAAPVEKPKKKKEDDEGGDDEEGATPKKKSAPRKPSAAANARVLEAEAQKALYDGHNPHLNCFEHSGLRYEETYPIYERLYGLVANATDRMILKCIIPIRMGAIPSTLVSSSPNGLIGDTKAMIGGRDNTGLLDVFRKLIVPVWFVPVEALLAEKPSGNIPNKFLCTVNNSNVQVLEDQSIVEHLLALAKDTECKGVRKTFFNKTILNKEAAQKFFAVVDKCMAIIKAGGIFVDNDDVDNSRERKVQMLTLEEASLRAQFEAAKKEAESGNKKISRASLLALRDRHTACVQARRDESAYLEAERKNASNPIFPKKKEHPYPDIFSYGVGAYDHYYIKEQLPRISETTLRWRHVNPFKFKSIKRIVSGAASLAKMKVKKQTQLGFTDADLKPFRAHYMHVVNGGNNDFVSANEFRMDRTFEPDRMLILDAKEPDPPLSFGPYALRQLIKMRTPAKESVAELSLNSDDEAETKKPKKKKKGGDDNAAAPPPPPSVKDEGASSGSDEDDEDEDGGSDDSDEESGSGNSAKGKEKEEEEEKKKKKPTTSKPEAKKKKEEEEEDSMDLIELDLDARLDDAKNKKEKKKETPPPTSLLKRKADDAELSMASSEKPATKKAKGDDAAPIVKKKTPVTIDLVDDGDAAAPIDKMEIDDDVDNANEEAEEDEDEEEEEEDEEEEEENEVVYSSDDEMNSILKNTLNACQGFFTSDPAELVINDADGDDRLECLREEGRRLNSLHKAHNFHQAYPTATLIPSLVELEAALETASRLGNVNTAAQVSSRNTADLFSTLTLLRAGTVFFHIPNVLHVLASTIRDTKGAIEEKYESVLIDYLKSTEGPQQIAQVATLLKAVIKLYTKVATHLDVSPADED